jgi:hypothetical protein
MTSGISDTRPRAPATIIERLAPVADRLRALRDRVGLSPWRTWVIAYRWTGGGRGRGEPILFKEVELNPRPVLRSAAGLRVSPTSGGVVAEGVVHLAEISARYTEDDLDLLFQPTPDDVEVFVEMALDGRDGPRPERYAFRPAGKPQRDAAGLQWTLDLRAVEGGRTRDRARRPWSDE